MKICKAARDDIIPLQYGISGKHSIKVSTGQIIYVSARDGINVNEQIWGDDATVFNPQRWLSSKGKFDLDLLPQAVRDIQVVGNMMSFGAG
jgi:hypothetical protein